MLVKVRNTVIERYNVTGLTLATDDVKTRFHEKDTDQYREQSG